MFKRSFIFVICFVSTTLLYAKESQPWIEKSNENAQILLEVMARFSPESAGRLGVDGMDDQILDLNEGIEARSRAATKEALKKIQERAATEKDPLVKQDLEILIDTAQDQIKASEMNEKYQIPYFNVTQAVFGGLRALLDDQIPAERRQAALVRLKKYAGTEKGFTPIAKLAEARIREKLNDKTLVGPIKEEVRRDLGNADFFMNGIDELFKKYSIAGYESAFEQLKVQLKEFNAFIEKEVMPRARDDYRLPEPIYLLTLDQFGTDIPPAQLAGMARKAFTEIQAEMQKLAPQVAKEKGYKVTDYRQVIAELKKKQLIGEEILPHYKARIKQIEEIIRKQNIITLPEREMRMRVATEAESANSPAPNMRPPRLIGNQGETGEFVLPLNIPAKPGEKQLKYDDFTFDAASWTLTVHEGRPGHELQFDGMVERGVSIARAVFAFNSVNVEGWALYSEAVMLPFEPKEGQLIALQHRLLRSARAYLDPELQMGKITPAQAKDILMKDVVLSEAMATQEVERYTFRAPGQAPSYFYGYVQLLDMRKETEKALGKKFDQKKFHDFIIGQGLLPPALLRKALREEFVQSAMPKAASM